MNRGMIRDPFQPEQLVEPKAKQDLKRWLLRSSCRLAGNEPIQSALPSNNPISEFLEQTAVWRNQLVAPEFPRKQIFRVLAVPFPILQDVGGDFSQIHPYRLVQGRGDVICEKGGGQLSRSCANAVFWAEATQSPRANPRVMGVVVSAWRNPVMLCKTGHGCLSHE
jgi:hypothetical protein